MSQFGCKTFEVGLPDGKVLVIEAEYIWDDEDLFLASKNDDTVARVKEWVYWRQLPSPPHLTWAYPKTETGGASSSIYEYDPTQWRSI